MCPLLFSALFLVFTWRITGLGCPTLPWILCSTPRVPPSPLALPRIVSPPEEAMAENTPQARSSGLWASQHPTWHSVGDDRFLHCEHHASFISALCRPPADPAQTWHRCQYYLFAEQGAKQDTSCSLCKQASEKRGPWEALETG